MIRAIIKISNKSEIPGYGGVYWQYFLRTCSSEATEFDCNQRVCMKSKNSRDQLVEIANEKIKT
jgi:hypothetical protein